MYLIIIYVVMDTMFLLEDLKESSQYEEMTRKGKTLLSDCLSSESPFTTSILISDYIKSVNEFVSELESVARRVS